MSCNKTVVSYEFKCWKKQTSVTCEERLRRSITALPKVPLINKQKQHSKIWELHSKQYSENATGSKEQLSRTVRRWVRKSLMHVQLWRRTLSAIKYIGDLAMMMDGRKQDLSEYFTTIIGTRSTGICLHFHVVVLLCACTHCKHMIDTDVVFCTESGTKSFTQMDVS